MKKLDPARRMVKQVAWATSLGVLAALAHAFVVLWATALFESLGDYALPTSLLLLAALAGVAVFLAGLVVQLERWWGAMAGAIAALVPVGVLLVVEPGALGTAPALAMRAVAVLLSAATGALATYRGRSARPREP